MTPPSRRAETAMRNASAAFRLVSPGNFSAALPTLARSSNVSMYQLSASDHGDTLIGPNLHDAIPTIMGVSANSGKNGDGNLVTPLAHDKWLLVPSCCIVCVQQRP